MGNCISNDAMGTSEERSKNKDIEKGIREDREKENKTIRILLLGAGDSGKSTVVKQMRIIHNHKWGTTEIESYRQLAFSNVLDGIREILSAMRDDLDLEIMEENEKYLPLVMKTAYNVKDGDPYPPTLLEPLTALWADPNVKAAYQRGNEVALPDSLHYFLDSLPRLWAPNFQVSNDDILHCRARTTGMTETTFKSNDHILRLIDVGGQKSERRKWINFFQDVTSILFLVSLSGYDECLIEDRDANQMQDAMQIWDGICNSQWFSRTAFILFLNKSDLFEAKLKHSPIRASFPDYSGNDDDVAAGKDYFRKRFVSLCQKSKKEANRDVYTHYTTATDTKHLKVVMKAVEGPLLFSQMPLIYVPDPHQYHSR
ncbi:guanine nucleotide binding protein, alpha subunit [Clavulina sp. PMI_390]|nr:guanine nucleotide binding protein, alpha subunit [Clavulina sp. PMI_390]